jgi:hypothetical protein
LVTIFLRKLTSHTFFENQTQVGLGTLLITLSTKWKALESKEQAATKPHLPSLSFHTLKDHLFESNFTTNIHIKQAAKMAFF